MSNALWGTRQLCALRGALLLLIHEAAKPSWLIPSSSNAGGETQGVVRVRVGTMTVYLQQRPASASRSRGAGQGAGTS
ncbi:hypothetical protein A4R35_10360 [Thermogemmatispora tikiterensis]|uniref:Uncharacterized protein n=1 Tax=Thermogemmatispora tikiterensis TaxID=1825093 RepID=A0A328VEI3_9CHLR|nr:hypothetical protein A4R35_10360 [Thermogemmatispora tikiterensis]